MPAPNDSYAHPETYEDPTREPTPPELEHPRRIYTVQRYLIRQRTDTSVEVAMLEQRTLHHYDAVSAMDAAAHEASLHHRKDAPRTETVREKLEELEPGASYKIEIERECSNSDGRYTIATRRTESGDDELERTAEELEEAVARRLEAMAQGCTNEEDRRAQAGLVLNEYRTIMRNAARMLEQIDLDKSEDWTIEN